MSKIIDETNRGYIEGLIPKGIPDWKKSWQEGYKIGKSIEIPDTPFNKKYGVKDEVEYRSKMANQGIVTWQINTGLASVDEQVAALHEAEAFNEETGLRISYAHQLPKNIVGTPKDKRNEIPTALGFDLDRLEDWRRIATAAPIQPIFGDNHLGYPNAVFMTINCLKAGCRYQGLFGTFQQVAPGCPDEGWNMNENVKALGICAAKYDEKVIVNSNMDDSLPSYCMDLASYLAWAKWERYVVSDLCKARYSFSFGNLITNLVHKCAMWLAASDTFKKDDQPGIEFIYPNTVDHWSDYLHSNYGFLIPEALMVNLFERRYRTGGSFLMVPITEKVKIPTVEDMLNIAGACQRTDECVEAFEQMMDWTAVENLCEKVKDFSDKMFKNILSGLKEAGVDIENPIEMMVVFKEMDPNKFEQLFHPSIINDSKDRIIPLMPVALWEQSEKLALKIYEKIKNTVDYKRIKNKDVCVVSGDMHSYGLYVISRVLEKLGANVVDGGNAMEALDTLDLADEYGINDICISLHNGQALAYAKLIKQLARDRKTNYRFFMGGQLTSFLNEDDTEPVDVTDQLQQMDIVTTETVEDLVKKLII